MVISRRSCRRAGIELTMRLHVLKSLGVRYRTRGADPEGNVANFVETEQLMCYNGGWSILSELAYSTCFRYGIIICSNPWICPRFVEAGNEGLKAYTCSGWLPVLCKLSALNALPIWHRELLIVSTLMNFASTMVKLSWCRLLIILARSSSWVKYLRRRFTWMQRLISSK